MLKRRYEMHLPLRHNDGRPVSDDKLNETREELVERFDAVSVQPQTVLENLDTPWGIDFLPDDSMIFTERPGRVTIFANGQRREVGRVQTNQMAESGLLGIAVDPEFQKNRSV